MRYFACKHGPALGPVHVLCKGHDHDTADSARSCGPHVWGQQDAMAPFYAGKGHVGAVTVRRVFLSTSGVPPAPPSPPSRPGAASAVQEARERFRAADVALRGARLRAGRPSEAARLALEIARLSAAKRAADTELRAAEDEWLGSAEYQETVIGRLSERAKKIQALPLED